MVRPGLDLVGMMIDLGIASRQNRRFVLDPYRELQNREGWAIEARVYAEIPSLGFKPSPGLLQRVDFPSRKWLRVDTWAQAGSKVSPLFGGHIVLHPPQR